VVIQQGQVLKLKARCADGDPLWAYRYRIAGRGSARRQVGGFSSKAEAQRALQNKLARLLPGRRAAALTLGEWVEEYLDAHQGGRVTVAKLRWLLGKATAELGEVRLAELSPEQVCAWRLTVPEGHRFEATQALRQVLNRAVAWKLIDENPAKQVIPNPRRRCREQRPFDSWAQIRSLAERLGPMFGPMVVFAAATGLRPSELFALEQSDLDRAAGVVQVRRAYANGRVKQTKTRLSGRAVPLQAIALEALDLLPLRDHGPLLFPNTRGGHLLTFYSMSEAGAFMRARRFLQRPVRAREALASRRPLAGWTVAVRGGRQKEDVARPSPLPIYTVQGACGKPPVVPHNHRSQANAYRKMGERNARLVVDVSGRSVAMNEHAVVIAGGGPTGPMLAGELALAGIDVVIVERRRENREPTYDAKAR
jgi:integrase